jgi:tripartite-type tricarboxylate transporter receptor subunit TctC
VRREYEASDFATIAIAASTPEILVNNAVGPKTLKDVVALSKVKPVNFGTAGAGSASYILTEFFFRELAKGQATHIPFTGGAPALNAIVANHIDLVGAAMAGGFVPQMQSGVLRGLAVASEKRIKIVPDVPTYAECGYPELVARSWVGFFAPAKTPSGIVNTLNAAIHEIMKEPDVFSRTVPAGYDPEYGSPTEAEAMFQTDIAKWRKMVEALGLQIN